MWEWPEQHFRTRDLSDETALAEFVAGLVACGDGLLDIDRSVVSRYGMKALPLVEWDHSEEALALFEELRRTGSTRGFFIDYPGQEELGHCFGECELSEAAAAAIWEQDLFGWATIFVDDKFQSAIASWFTDFTHLCMSPSLFDAYLAASPMRLDLGGDATETPATTFSVALEGATQRQGAWSRLLKEMRQKVP